MSNDDQNSMDDFFGLVQEYLKGDKDQPAHTPARLLSKFNALQLSKGNRTLLVANKLVINFSKSNFVYGNMEKLEELFWKILEI
uniref:Uncharacterized protein n=1 Tax=Ditylenchus dipsaci TaxID=166011 RepID=A0A915CYR3_9BILA